MKKLILALSLLVWTQAFAISPRDILDLEKRGQNLEALQAAIEYYGDVSNSLQLDRFVAEIQTLTNTVNKEVVVQTVHEDRQWKRSGSGGYMAFFSTGRSIKQWDITQWIIDNPEEVARRKYIVSGDMQRLQRNVREYIIANKEKLKILKVVATKAMQLSSQVSDADFLTWAPTLERMYATSSYFEFSGQHTKLHCDVSQHASTFASTNSDTTFAVATVNETYVGQEKLNKTVQSNGYEVKRCASSTETTTPSSAEMLQSQFIQIDRNLNDWYRQISVRYLKVARPPEFISWGSPYYK